MNCSPVIPRSTPASTPSEGRQWRRLAVLASLATLSLSFVASAGALPGPAGPDKAEAADSCGGGWHKQSDGNLSASQSDSRGAWTVKASLSGKVRYCTRERTLGDQKNQRVYVGLPSQMVSVGRYSGTGVKEVCLTTKIVVNAKHISSGSTISVGFDGGKPSGSYSDTYTSTSKTIQFNDCRKPGLASLDGTVTGVRFTAPDCGRTAVLAPVITSVTVTTTASLKYQTASAGGSRTAVATNTDKSTWSTFSC